MASSCIACCIFHIISIPFNCSDTALRVTDVKIGSKVKMFVFRWALSIRPKIPEIPGLGANGTDIFRNFIPKFWVYLARLA